MKALIIAVAMMVSSTAMAWSADYGKGSYVKQTRVCYKGNDRDCQINTYRYTKPRLERVCYGNGHNSLAETNCFMRLTTENYGSFVGTRAEWDELFRGSHSRP